MEEEFFTVWADSRDNRGTWSEFDCLDTSRLSLADAEEVAEAQARRLSAHWGHIRWRRWGNRVWRVWEPGEDGVDCWIRIRSDAETGTGA